MPPQRIDGGKQGVPVGGAPYFYSAYQGENRYNSHDSCMFILNCEGYIRKGDME